MLDDAANRHHADWARDLWIIALRHELVVVAVPQRDVVVTTVGRYSHERLRHKAWEGTELTADLLADLTVGRKAVSGEFCPVEVEVEFELTRGVLVIALNHVKAHCLAVFHHTVDQRLQLCELIDVVTVRFGESLNGGLAVGIDLQPHHLGFATGAEVESVLGFKLGVDPLQIATTIRREEGAAVYFLFPTAK